ncbi:hypothetical protein D5086_004375 [Populus alba]|uniref:Uncharacterized protein n=1 Tax=Populus alba TaxID=43335 RepID=A0ACC4CQM3_POPAL
MEIFLSLLISLRYRESVKKEFCSEKERKPPPLINGGGLQGTKYELKQHLLRPIKIFTCNNGYSQQNYRKKRQRQSAGIREAPGSSGNYDRQMVANSICKS